MGIGVRVNLVKKETGIFPLQGILLQGMTYKTNESQQHLKSRVSELTLPMRTRCDKEGTYARHPGRVQFLCRRCARQIV